MFSKKKCRLSEMSLEKKKIAILLSAYCLKVSAIELKKNCSMKLLNWRVVFTKWGIELDELCSNFFYFSVSISNFCVGLIKISVICGYIFFFFYMALKKSTCCWERSSISWSRLGPMLIKECTKLNNWFIVCICCYSIMSETQCIFLSWCAISLQEMNDSGSPQLHIFFAALSTPCLFNIGSFCVPCPTIHFGLFVWNIIYWSNPTNKKLLVYPPYIYLSDLSANWVYFWL